MSDDPITGYEPRIASQNRQKNRLWRLSPRNLATMLNILPDDAVSLEAVEVALYDQNFLVRSSAAKRLVSRHDRDARLILEKALAEGTAPVQANIARHLYGMSWFSAAPLLKQAIANTDYRVREGAVYSLCQIGTLDAYQFLLEALAHEIHDFVLGAPAMEWGLVGRRDPLAVDVIQHSLRAEDPEIRAKALETLSTTEQLTAGPLIWETMLNDPESNVIYNGALSYTELIREECLSDFAPALLQILDDPMRVKWILRGFFHASNYRHLDLLASPHLATWLDTLETIMKNQHDIVREQVIWCLAWLNYPRASSIVQEAFQNEANPTLKIHILNTAANLMMDGSYAMVIDALTDSDENLQTVGQHLNETLALGIKI